MGLLRWGPEILLLLLHFEVRAQDLPLFYKEHLGLI